MSLVSLSRIKSHLNIVKDDQDDLLQDAIDSAETEVAGMLGLSSLSSHTVVERVFGPGTSLVLTAMPVISITSIAGPGGIALDLTGLDNDYSDGLIRSTSTSVSFPSAWYTVTYTAGFTSLPADLEWAVCEVVRDDWQALRGSGARAGQGQPDQPGRLTARTKVANYNIPGFA